MTSAIHARRAHLLFDLHREVDGLREEELAGGKIGTTKRGIGPAYASKVVRNGIRVGELRRPETFKQKLKVSERENRLWYLQSPSRPRNALTMVTLPSALRGLFDPGRRTLMKLPSGRYIATDEESRATRELHRTWSRLSEPNGNDSSAFVLAKVNLGA